MKRYRNSIKILKRIWQVIFPFLLFIVLPVALLFLSMWYFIYVKQGVNPLCYKYAVSDIIAFIVGMLAYYGTVFLGYIAVVQNYRLIGQNEKLFFTDKSSSITIYPEIVFKRYEYNANFLPNSHDGEPANYYITSPYENIIFTEKDKSFSFAVKYQVDGPIIKQIKLDRIKIHQCGSNLFVDKHVITDVISKVNPRKKVFENFFEVFIIGVDTLENIKQLLISDDLIIDLSFTIINIYKVETKMLITLNFEDFFKNKTQKDKNEFLVNNNSEYKGYLDNVSYYYLDDKGGKKNDK